jgi:hypothetical protein
MFKLGLLTGNPFTVDHRFALSIHLMSAPSKNHSQRQLPILAHVSESGAGCSDRQIEPEPNSPAAPSTIRFHCDLVGMHVKGLRQLGKRLIALDRRQRHFRLEGA